jgi:predicted aldo/keto reductase-like oxidoreductase
MRLPNEEAEAIKLIRYAIDHGVNYLDTAYVYGNSEVVTGKALQDGYRSKVSLVTKSPIWNIKSHADFEKYLDEELQRLGTDHIDVYLLHNLFNENWEIVKKYDGLTFLDNMIKKGKILHKGFSIHSTTAAFKEIVDSYDWDMAQIQLNILDENHQVGVDGLEYGFAKGLAMVIMEPLRGGAIVNNAPEEVHTLLNAYPDKRSLAEWCFRWLYNKPEVSVILSGTSTLDQLKDNLRIFEHSAPMNKQDMELIQNIRKIYESKNTIGCTGCGYCMPCPQGINIPDIFKMYNTNQVAKSPIDLVFYQHSIVDAGCGADQCVSCDHCKEHCPQNLEIPALLKKVHKELTDTTNIKTHKPE